MPDSCYLPRSHERSLSALSSASASFDEERPSQPPSRSSTSDSQTGGFPADPLSRHYPKPAADIDVAEALAREPRRWSLAYWMKNAKEISNASPSKEARARKFDEAKKELLKAKLQLARLPAAKR